MSGCEVRTVAFDVPIIRQYATCDFAVNVAFLMQVFSSVVKAEMPYADDRLILVARNTGQENPRSILRRRGNVLPRHAAASSRGSKKSSGLRSMPCSRALSSSVC